LHETLAGFRAAGDGVLVHAPVDPSMTPVTAHTCPKCGAVYFIGIDPKWKHTCRTHRPGRKR
jgi:hypothetical protein